MSVLDNSYKDTIAGTNGKPKGKIWCEEDHHHLFEFFADFNEWIDGDDGQEIRERYSIDGLTQPSKAFYASDPEAYNQAFKIFRKQRKEQVLGEEYIREQFLDEHWFERSEQHFEQLMECFLNNSVVPFIGAGLSVDGGFPSWKKHLQQQGRTSGIDAEHINDLLDNGQYEEVIEEIEAKGYRDAFIQEIKDVFSKTGRITDTTLRITELFTDTVITTNYDRLIEQAFDTGEENEIQLIDSSNILESAVLDKITIIKLHGDIKSPVNCILGKKQYDKAYGNGTLDLKKPIPKLLSYHYKTSNLLFLGCSLNQDRTMQVFQAIKNQMGDIDKPQHFSIESIPENEAELIKRNHYLLSFGITPIWFPNGCYDYIEQILRLARNEIRYRGYTPGEKKSISEQPIDFKQEVAISRTQRILNLLTNLLN